jgi:hypothetical protein
MPQTTTEILHGATRGAKYNVVLQIVFRIVTFGMNAVVLRFVSKATLGIANVRLMLLYTTALLFSREAIRKAALDLRPHYEHGERAVDVVQCRNLSWCSVPAGAVITAVLSLVWTKVMYAPEHGGDGAGVAEGESTTDDGAYYNACVLLYAAAVMLELLCDSLYIRCQNEMRQRVCVMAEGAAIIVRAGVTVGLAIARPGLGIIAFGLGQVAFGATLCAAYFGCVRACVRAFMRACMRGRGVVQRGPAGRAGVQLIGRASALAGVGRWWKLPAVARPHHLLLLGAAGSILPLTPTRSMATAKRHGCAHENTNHPTSPLPDRKKKCRRLSPINCVLLFRFFFFLPFSFSFFFFPSRIFACAC